MMNSDDIDWVKEAEVLEREIREYPNDEEAHYRMGLVYTRLNSYEEAVEVLKQAIRIDPYYV